MVVDFDFTFGYLYSMIAAANICIQLCCEYLICFCCFWVAVVDLAATDGDDDGGDFD